MPPARCGQQLDKDIFRTRDNSSMDVGQVVFFCMLYILKVPNVQRSTFFACQREHIDVEHGLFLFVPLCQFVSQPAQHLTIGILSKFLFCNILSDTVGNRNSVKYKVSKIGFPLSMQIVQLLEN